MSKKRVECSFQSAKSLLGIFFCQNSSLKSYLPGIGWIILFLDDESGPLERLVFGFLFDLTFESPNLSENFKFF